jgi:hypothetical protein
MSDEATLCPFCNHVLDIKMFDGTYGCDTGCDYVRFEVECPGCKRSIYETGSFGSAFDDWDDTTEAEYRSGFMAEFAEAVQRINTERARGGL